MGLYIDLTLVHTILTATFHKAVESDPGCTSNKRCFFWPEASLAVLWKKIKSFHICQMGWCVYFQNKCYISAPISIDL